MKELIPPNFNDLTNVYFYKKYKEYPQSINIRINFSHEDCFNIVNYLAKKYPVVVKECGMGRYEKYLYKIEENLYFLMNFEVVKEDSFSMRYYYPCFLFFEDKTSAIDEITKEIKSLISKPNSNLFLLTQNSQNGFELLQMQRNIDDIDIKLNYNDDFILEYDNILNTLKSNSANKGLILFHGEPGTGKTNLIKFLTTVVNKKFIIIPANSINIITEPKFLDFLIKNKNSILILEDSENFLTERNGGNMMNSVNSILNITDGIYSDFLNVKIICTFNSNINKIDKALFRKGRIGSEYKFEKLSIDKTNILLKHLNYDFISKEEMSLADIYNLNDNGFKIKNKIGF